MVGRLMAGVTVSRRSLRWCHPSVTLGTAYHKVAVVNSPLSQDAVSRGVNSMSSCPSSPPAHFPSLPEEEFTIRVSGVPCSMQAKPGPQTYPTCITCNVTTELWFAGCAESPPRTKWARRISWKRFSLTIWQRYSTPATQMARPCKT